MQDATRPEGWQLPDHTKTIRLDYFGKPYEAYERIKRVPDYGKLWQQFSEDFKNQEPKDITGRSSSFSPNLELIEIKEVEHE